MLFPINATNVSILHYKVMSIKIVDAGDAANFLFSQDPTTPSQLNLITCTGTFDQKTNYDKRLIVSTKLL